MGVTKEVSVDVVKSSEPIPEGKAKSGRMWKVKQTVRSSTQKRQGILSHLNKTFEEKEAIRQKAKEVKNRENDMIKDKKNAIIAEKTRREEQNKRRIENELKTTTYTQVLAPVILFCLFFNV